MGVTTCNTPNWQCNTLHWGSLWAPEWVDMYIVRSRPVPYVYMSVCCSLVGCSWSYKLWLALCCMRVRVCLHVNAQHTHSLLSHAGLITDSFGKLHNKEKALKEDMQVLHTPCSPLRITTCACILAFTVFPFPSFRLSSPSSLLSLLLASPSLPPSPLSLASRLLPLFTLSLPSPHPLLGCMWTCCFICGLQKEKLEDIPHGFDQHTMREHHMAHYMWGVGRSGEEWPSQCYVYIPSLPLCLMQVLSDAPHKEAYSYSGVATLSLCSLYTYPHTFPCLGSVLWRQKWDFFAVAETLRHRKKHAS